MSQSEGLAVWHARIAGLVKPLIAFGRSASGIDWNAPDGVDARFIYLVITPAEDPDVQVHILRNIALTMSNESFRQKLLVPQTPQELWDILHSGLMKRIIPR